MARIEGIGYRGQPAGGETRDRIVVDREKASKLGLDVRTIGKAVETFFAGTTATRYREGGDEYDIELRLRPEDRGRIQDLRDLYVSTPLGAQVSLANCAELEQGLGQPDRQDQTASSRCQARSAGRTSARWHGCPGGWPKSLAGSAIRSPGWASREAYRSLLWAIGLGMIWSIWSASQFNHRDPFIIFLSVRSPLWVSSWCYG
jgi:HAE1 family hydrophobic/amphiphilic exporter-1